MTTPQEHRAKAGAKLGSQLEFYTVKTSLDITPGMKTEAAIKAEVAAIPGIVAGADYNAVVKELPSQTRLDMFVQTINEFGQPIIMNFMPAFAADTNGDTGGIMFAYEHVGCASVAKIQAALAAAIVANGDAADLAAAVALITVTKQ
jgi:hypothetical protein